MFQDMEQRAMSYHSQGLARALAALKALSRAERALTLSELASDLELPKSTLIRLLAVMEDEGFVYKEGDPPAYSVGHSVLEIADAYRPVDVATMAAPVMRDLARDLGFTTNLGILEGRSVLHLHVEEPSRALRFAASGTLDFPHCTGLGKLLLSRLPVDEIAECLPESEPYVSFTPKTITDRAALDEELESIRKAGYSVDDEERNRGVTCLAVLVPARVSFPISLSISAPSGELTPADRERYRPLVDEAALTLASDPRFVSSLAILGNKVKG